MVDGAAIFFLVKSVASQYLFGYALNRPSGRIRHADRYRKSRVGFAPTPTELLGGRRVRRDPGRRSAASLADAYQAAGYCLRNLAAVAAYLAKRSENS